MTTLRATLSIAEKHRDAYKAFKVAAEPKIHAFNDDRRRLADEIDRLSEELEKEKEGVERAEKRYERLEGDYEELSRRYRRDCKT